MTYVLKQLKVKLFQFVTIPIRHYRMLNCNKILEKCRKKTLTVITFHGYNKHILLAPKSLSLPSSIVFYKNNSNKTFKKLCYNLSVSQNHECEK